MCLLRQPCSVGNFLDGIELIRNSSSVSPGRKAVGDTDVGFECMLMELDPSHIAVRRRFRTASHLQRLCGSWPRMLKRLTPGAASALHGRMRTDRRSARLASESSDYLNLHSFLCALIVVYSTGRASSKPTNPLFTKRVANMRRARPSAWCDPRRRPLPPDSGNRMDEGSS